MAETRTTAPPDDIGALWAAFRARPDHQTRNKLMEHYLPLVKYIAERLRAGVPNEVQFDDLFSAGVFGLMDAVKAYEPERGVKFETYSARRIRGAILDELRSMDWAPRLVRSRAHKLKDAVQTLRAALGRTPTDEEVARKMGLSLKAFQKFRGDAHPVGLVSLNRTWYETDSQKEVREIDFLEDQSVEDPRLAVQREDLRQLVTHSLNFTERLIVLMYYFEGMTMSEIGQTLDLSESRVSQMHSAILARLRADATLGPR